MSHSDIAHTWAHEDYGRNGGRSSGNMFSREMNRGIYSYGYHFCIARHTDVGGFRILHTYRTYSTSTQQHIGHVWSALSSPQREHMFYCYNPEGSGQQIYDHEITDHLPGLAREWVQARDAADKMQQRVDKREAKGQEPSEYLEDLLEKRNNERDQALVRVRDRAQELERFRIAFELKVKDQSKEVKLLRKKFLADNWQRVTEQQEKAAERERIRRERAAEELRKKRIAEQAENLERWLRGEDVRLGYYGGAAQMRVKGDEVQTTQGARVKVVEAARALRFIHIIRRRGTDWRANGDRCPIGPFELSSVNKDGVVVGCHRFTFEELDRVGPEITNTALLDPTVQREEVEL